MGSDKVRQAVVVVHGMGEQRPQQQIRALVDAVVGPRVDPSTSGQPPIRRYFSRPDRISGELETRRLLLPRHPYPGYGQANESEQSAEVTRRWAQTEIYEYHWAHHMADNSLAEALPMLRRTMLTIRPGRAWNLWLFLWLLLAALGALVWNLWPELREALTSGEETIPAVWFVLGASGAAAAVYGAVIKFLASQFRSSFIDVARYLSTSPTNLDARRKIRNGLVELLDGLHNMDGGERYDRIIVLCHSLGSYIGYEAIGHLWSRYARLHSHPGDPQSQPALEALAPAAQQVETTNLAAQRFPSRLWIDNKQSDDEAVSRYKDSVEWYQAAQTALWVENRNLGNPWAITDFITFGSPMTFAHLIMDKPKWLRRRRQPLWAKDEQMQSYELPTCPPRPEPAPSTPWPDDQAERWFSWPNWDVQVLHHAAPFAVTRWTNYWFTPYLGLFGDVFGGPLRNNFGPGIKDIAVRFSAKDFFLRRSRFTQLLPAFPHAFYFKHFEKGSRPAGPAVETLRIALRLDSHDLLAWVDAPDFDQKTQFIEALYRSEMGRDAEYHDIGSQLGALAESAIRWAAGEFQR